jgi:hypothetical protein
MGWFSGDSVSHCSSRREHGNRIRTDWKGERLWRGDCGSKRAKRTPTLLDSSVTDKHCCWRRTGPLSRARSVGPRPGVQPNTGLLERLSGQNDELVRVTSSAGFSSEVATPVDRARRRHAAGAESIAGTHRSAVVFRRFSQAIRDPLRRTLQRVRPCRISPRRMEVRPICSPLVGN